MANFSHIVSGVNTQLLLEQLLSQPELWNKNPCRLSKRGPHHQTQDIILRYKDEVDNIRRGDFSDFADLHMPDWYQSIDRLPAVKELAFNLMTRMQGEVMGAVLIYKVQPGKSIHIHSDHGWHAGYYEKFNICLQSNPKAAFVYDDDRMVQKAGDIHHFRNDVLHSVINEGDTDHIVLIVCLRLDRGYRTPWSPEGWTFDKPHAAIAAQGE